jgi:hypothetical protein
MDVTRIHTSDKDKVISMLNNLVIEGEFWDYTLSWEMDLKNQQLQDLTNPHYFNMPEFEWTPYLFERTIVAVYTKNDIERKALLRHFGQKEDMVSTYFHYALKEHPLKHYHYEYTHKITPKYPIYVITKGRWEKRLTIESLEEMGIDFNICVEPSEYDKYAAVVDVKKIIKLPEDFSKRKQGSIPVRNFVWQHAVDNGHKKHWVIDDNILGFFRWNHNLKKRIRDGVFFRVMEDFSDRYENLGLVGAQYASFIPAIEPGRPVFIQNTRVYSCILINHELLDTRLTERWRGTYNEDTDLSLRVLSTGDLCTVNFNNFITGKQTTGTMRGGNTDTIYDGGTNSGYWKKFKELKDNWGHIVTLTNEKHKDGRPHHHIAYTHLFKQELVLKPGIPTEPKVNEYNMVLVKNTPATITDDDEDSTD